VAGYEPSVFFPSMLLPHSLIVSLLALGKWPFLLCYFVAEYFVGGTQPKNLSPSAQQKTLGVHSYTRRIPFQ
jgi:hypothetical protein